MADWDIWVWLAYAGLWIGGIILFADGALRTAPAVPAGRPRLKRLIESNLWAFAPVSFAALASIILIAHQFGWLKSIPKMQQVFDTTFTHQQVVVDNHQFYNCTFDDVTFIYSGGDYLFDHVTFRNGAMLRGTVGATANALKLAQFLSDAHSRSHNGQAAPH
jgi:hypothetical protein